MKSWLLLMLSLGATSIAVRAGDGAPSPEKPNILFMVADDLGIGDLGCYGASRIKTPNIDRLAAGGVRFLDAHATASVCTPSRYAMLTGENYYKIPNEAGWEGQLLIPPGMPTVASILKAAGYRTAYFGKWHLGWGISDPSRPRSHRSDWNWNAGELKPGVLECGFDRFFGTPFSANEPPFVFVDQRTVVGRDPNDPIVVTGPRETKEGFGWGVSSGADAAHKARRLDHIDFLVSDKVCEFIEQNRERPFFVQFALVAPHVPVAPSAEFQGRSGSGAYGDFIEQMDAAVGRVLDTLEKAGLNDRTLVVFTSDNGAIGVPYVLAGGHRQNQDYLGQKTDAWEGGVRIPFIASWPGRIPAGSTCHDLLSLGDCLATFCSAAGAPVPAGAASDSINQLPVLEDPSLPPLRNEMVYQAIHGRALRSGNWVYIPKQGSLGVTTDPNMGWAMQFGEWKFVNSDFDKAGNLLSGAPEAQLYNLSSDPSQARNVLNDHPDAASRLAARLREFDPRSK